MIISKMVFIGINLNLLGLIMFNVEKQTKKIKKSGNQKKGLLR